MGGGAAHVGYAKRASDSMPGPVYSKGIHCTDMGPLPTNYIY